MAMFPTCICSAPHESCECPMHPTCQGAHLVDGRTPREIAASMRATGLRPDLYAMYYSRHRARRAVDAGSLDPQAAYAARYPAAYRGGYEAIAQHRA